MRVIEIMLFINFYIIDGYFFSLYLQEIVVWRRRIQCSFSFTENRLNGALEIRTMARC